MGKAVTVAAHLLYGIPDIETELKKMLAVAKEHFCFIIRVGRQRGNGPDCPQPGLSEYRVGREALAGAARSGTRKRR
jgi:hypothetical protein